jgi:hypothetical protein
MLLNNFNLLNLHTMKKIQYIIAPAVALMMFAACNTEVKGPSQAEIDAQVDAKVKSATEQLKAECDSRIMTAAQLKKDSILVKLGQQKPAPAAPAPVKAAPPKQNTPKADPVKAEPVKNPKQDRFDRTDGKKTTTEADTKKKEDRFDGGEKKTVTPEDTKKKAERFKK